MSALSFGSWVTFGSQVDTGLAKDCLSVAREGGINFFDRAEAGPAGLRRLRVDSAGSFSWYAEPTLTGSSFQNSVTGAPSWAAGLRKLRSALVVVANNGPNSVGGGGTPLAALAPALG